MMSRMLLISLFFISACGSGGDDLGDTSRIISVNSAVIPEMASIDIVWDRPPDGDQSWEFYLTSGGRIENGLASIEGPVPIPSQVVDELFGVAVGFIVVYQAGQAREYRAYSDEDIVPIDGVIGLATKHAMIYKSHDFIRPDWFPEDFEHWSDLFSLGYSCAENIPAELVTEEDGSVREGFDTFKPVDCSELGISIGDINELQIMNTNYT